MAILRGLHLAVDYSFLPVVLESDAKAVVELINSETSTYADIGIIIRDIVTLSHQFEIPISFVLRLANKVAHAFA